MTVHVKRAVRKIFFVLFPKQFVRHEKLLGLSVNVCEWNSNEQIVLEATNQCGHAGLEEIFGCFEAVNAVYQQRVHQRPVTR